MQNRTGYVYKAPVEHSWIFRTGLNDVGESLWLAHVMVVACNCSADGRYAMVEIETHAGYRRGGPASFLRSLLT